MSLWDLRLFFFLKHQDVESPMFCCSHLGYLYEPWRRYPTAKNPAVQHPYIRDVRAGFLQFIRQRLAAPEVGDHTLHVEVLGL